MGGSAAESEKDQASATISQDAGNFNILRRIERGENLHKNCIFLHSVELKANRSKMYVNTTLKTHGSGRFLPAHTSGEAKQHFALRYTYISRHLHLGFPLKKTQGEDMPLAFGEVTDGFT